MKPRFLILALFTAGAALADGDGDGSGAGAFAFSNEVEGSLVRTIVGLREGGLKSALGEIEGAILRNPNFRLGHLIQGDLLMARSGRPVAFGSMGASVNNTAHLQDEARVRLKRYFDAPPADHLPTPLMQMAPSQPHAILVDTTRSRLYIFANEAGKPKYVTDFYISLGKNGADKQREGDQKTPIGVYTITSTKEKLPDFYGPGAFPINYPNEWDRRHGRNGHGIWLHGTPSETYSRPPFATDGCVVLTNEDLNRLAKYVRVGSTPVVIGHAVEWQAPERWAGSRKEFSTAFEQWRQDWESLDHGRYLSHYAASFRSENHDRDSWSLQKRKVNAGKAWVKVGVNNLSYYGFHGATPTMVVTFEQDYKSSNLSNRTQKRQYWVREGTRWRIAHEAIVS